MAKSTAEAHKSRCAGHLRAVEAQLGGLADSNDRLREELEGDAAAWDRLTAMAGGACGGWGEMLDAVEARLMPEGMEWPRFEDGEPVRFGDCFLIDSTGETSSAIEYIEFGRLVDTDGPIESVSLKSCYGGGMESYLPGERVKRPAPKVLDADGAEIRVGDTLYKRDVRADGWELEPYVVCLIHHGLLELRHPDETGPALVDVEPSGWAHEKPEPEGDSWERLTHDYMSVNGRCYGSVEERLRSLDCDAMIDIFKRAKALGGAE